MSESLTRPGAAEVRAELERILRSRCFQQAVRASHFLRFVVEQTLAGAGQRLKGYTIGVEVFGRPADFDAQSDALVRVEAGRLRRRMVEYYAGEGAENPVRIELPRGSYAVEWRCAHNETKRGAAPVDFAPAAVPPESGSRRWRRLSAMLMLLLVAAGGVIAWQQWALLEAGRALDVLGEPQRTEWPRIVVVPFENLSAEPVLDTLAASVTEEVMLRLDGLDLFVVASQARWYGPSQGEGGLDTGAAGGYVLTGSVRGSDAQARITVRLIEADTGAQLWSAAYDEPLAIEQLPALQEQVARDVAAIAAPYGPIFEAELARARRSAHTPELRDCLVNYYDYRRRIDAATHKEALLCFQSVSARKPRVAQVWAGLAMLYLDEYAFRFSRGDEPLAAARQAAAKALALDRNDFLGNLALTRIQFFDGDPAFRGSIQRTLTLRPDSAEALAQGGILLTITGDSATGLPLVERARALSKSPPGLYNLAYAVTYLREGKFDEALASALKIDAPNWVVAQGVLAAAAALSGRDDIARVAAKRVLELHPTFESEGLDDIARWHFDELYYDVFVEGLRAAGLALGRDDLDPSELAY